MFSHVLRTGLDIGSQKIKLVYIKKYKNRFKIITYGSENTPRGAVESGTIVDPETVGAILAELVQDLRLKGKRVVAAVSGPQVYTRSVIMPTMKLTDLKEAVRYEATTFLPIPVEDAVMDIFPFHYFQDEEGAKVELFFVAVRRQQVQHLQVVCDIAGLKLAAVEIEPLAINRVVSEVDDNGVCAVLNMGAARSYLSVFRDQVPVYNRYLSFGSSAFINENNHSGNGLDGIVIGSQDHHEYLVRDVISELSRSIEYYSMQYPEGLSGIYICGGGSRMSGIDKAISSGLGIPVNIADILSRCIWPVPGNDKEIRNLRHDYPVALGLALRGGK